MRFLVLTITISQIQSEYYFKTRAMCTECLKKLSPEEKKRTLEDSSIARGATIEYSKTTTAFEINGYQIQKFLV